MSNGLFVRITDGLHLDMSGTVESVNGHDAYIKLTSTEEVVKVPRRWLRVETTEPVSVSEWRARGAGG